jgi:hypothetical protein
MTNTLSHVRSVSPKNKTAREQHFPPSRGINLPNVMIFYEYPNEFRLRHRRSVKALTIKV